MSLTQYDLVPDGLYRRKDNPKVIGRLSTDEGGVNGSIYLTITQLKKRVAGVYSGPFYFSLEDWEGIPITPEILRDWYKAHQPYNTDIYIIEIGDTKLRIDFMAEGFFVCMGYCPVSRNIQFVHEIQDLVFGFTGESLKGGPK